MHWLLILSIVGFCFTVGWMFMAPGFPMLNVRRTIDDTPTSKIATGAVGTNVEIKGRIAYDKLHKAPISGVKCVYYSLVIRKYYKSEKEDQARWHQLWRYATHKSFYIEDRSRAHALVKLFRAKLSFQNDPVIYRVKANELENMKWHLKQWLRKNPDKYKNFDIHYKEPGLFGNLGVKYEFEEQTILPKEEIFVRGYAESGTELDSAELPPIPSSQRKVSWKMFQKARKMIPSVSRLTRRFDANQDGILSDEEFQAGAQTLGEEMENRRSEGLKASYGHSVKMVFAAKGDRPLEVSSKTERAVGDDHAWQGMESIVWAILWILFIVSLAVAILLRI